MEKKNTKSRKADYVNLNWGFIHDKAPVREDIK
jgi:hypothetical protein